MRKGLKIILKVVGGLLVFLLAAAILLPVMFKKQILEAVRRNIDRQVEGEFSFEKADLGLLRTFPNLCLELTNPVLTGGYHPNGDSLFLARKAGVIVDIQSLLKQDAPIRVVGVELDGPRVSIYSDTSGHANYMLTATTDTISSESDSGDSIVVEVEKYSVSNGFVDYADAANNVRVTLDSLKHEGSMRYTGSSITLKSQTKSGIASVISEGIAYFERVHLEGENDLDIDLSTDLYRLAKNSMRLNALAVEASGMVQIDTASTLFDLSFSGEKNSLKNLLSLFPNVYTSDFDQLDASGEIALSGTLKGSLSETSVPVYTLDAEVENGAFQFPGKPLGFSEVQCEVFLTNDEQDWIPSEVNIPMLRFLLNENPFEMRLEIKDPAGSSEYSGTLKGLLLLADFKNAYPLPDIQELTGRINADVHFDIASSRALTEQVISGTLALEQILAVMEGQTLAMESGKIVFSPVKIDVTTAGAVYQESPFGVVLSILGFPQWLTQEKEMRISGAFNLGKFIQSTSVPGKIPEMPSAGLFPGLDRIQVDLKAAVEEFTYDPYVFLGNSAHLIGSLKSLRISDFKGTAQGTGISGSGTLHGIDVYLTEDGPLTGALNLDLGNLVIDRWIQNDTTSLQTTQGTTEYVELPDDLDLTIDFSADKLSYGNIRIQKPAGKILLKPGTVEIHEFTGNGMGGNMTLSGLYSTRDASAPVFSLKYLLQNIKFQEAFAQIETFRIAAPVAQYIQGSFNSNLVLEGKLGQGYLPDLGTLNASGFLETLTAKIEQSKLLEKVSQFLNLKNPINWDLANTRNWFEIKDGFLILQETTKTIDGIETIYGGRHQLRGEMDYLIKMHIPAEKVASNPVGALAQAGYAQLQSKAAAFGVQLQTIEQFTVHVSVKGKFNDPKFNIDFFDASGKTLKEAAVEQLDELKEQVKDSVTAIAEEKLEQARDSIEAVIEMAVDSAKKAAEEKLKEAGAAAVDKATEKLDSTIRDSITNAILDKLEQQSLPGTDKIKDILDKWDPLKKKKD